MPDTLGGFSLAWPVAAIVLGYLLGSVPFGLLLTRLAGLGDIRRIGSGNIGATNVLRTGNKGLAVLTVLLDGGKGTAAVMLAGIYGQEMALLAGGAAFLGHCFPVWLKFKGGKGVATYLGVMLGIAFPVGLLCCATWLMVAMLLRYSSLAALISAIAGPFYALWLADGQHAALAMFLAVVIFIRHQQNIRRLLKGEEPKIGKRRDAEAEAPG